MAEPFLGQIQMFGFNFNPRGWAKCDGQLLQISQYNALFALFGTFYGGDGRTTFGLPELRGRAAIHQGQGGGLSNRTIGQRSGNEQTILTVQNLAAHSHTYTPRANTGDGDDSNPTGRYPASGESTDLYADAQNANMGASTTADAGNNTPFNNMQPYLVVNFCVALQGLFPSRN